MVARSGIASVLLFAGIKHSGLRYYVDVEKFFEQLQAFSSLSFAITHSTTRYRRVAFMQTLLLIVYIGWRIRKGKFLS